MYQVLTSFFDRIEDFAVVFVHQYPFLGPLFLLLLEEAGVPLPVPGDAYISYIGYEISKHVVSYPVAFVLIVMAVFLGSSVLYFLSYHYGELFIRRYGKYLHLNEKKLAYIEKKFRQFGPLAIIVGRHIPGFRIPITVFSGLSKIDYRVFLASEFVSIVFSITLFLQLGIKLGKKTVGLFHNHYWFVFIFLIPVFLIAGMSMLGKFIPEEK